MPTVTAAELQKQFGLYREIARNEPVTVTHHGRESLVVMAIEEYRRLKALDTRRAYYPHELPDHIVTELEKGYQGDPTSQQDRLMK